MRTKFSKGAVLLIASRGFFCKKHCGTKYDILTVEGNCYGNFIAYLFRIKELEELSSSQKNKEETKWKIKSTQMKSISM